jgi:hypothetical protein
MKTLHSASVAQFDNAHHIASGPGKARGAAIDPSVEEEADARWQPHSLDWSVQFPRSPQHLSNQLRGKRSTSERESFDRVLSDLSPEVRKHVRENAISVVGFDLTVIYQRAYEGALRLLAATNYQLDRIVITPGDWLTAYDVQPRKDNRGWTTIPTFERWEAFSALLSLAAMPWLISYKKNDHGKWYQIQRVASLWRVEMRTPIGEHEAINGKITPEQLSRIDRIAIEFDPIFRDQQDSFYFYKPARLYTRIALVAPGKIKRLPRHLHPFLDWIFAEAGRLRVQQKQKPRDKRDWMIQTSWTELAQQCRMNAQLAHRNFKRIKQALLDSAELARNAQIITDYALDGETFRVTFDHRIFADLDEYLEAQQKKRDRAKAIAARPKPRIWKSAARLTLTEINKLIEEHEEEIRKVKAKIPTVYDRERGRYGPLRDLTQEEVAFIEQHREAIDELKALKLGVRPLKG